MSEIALIGHGSWATAIAKIVLEGDASLRWYVKNPEVAEHLRTHGSNPKYLRDVHFDKGTMHIFEEIDQAVQDADTVILAVPSAFLKEVLAPMTASLRNKMVISAIKGIIPGDYLTVAEYVAAHYALPMECIGVVTGPCHAEEVALERLSYLTMVCTSQENADKAGTIFRNDYIRVTTSTDLLGTEYAAVLKNIYAIAVGMAVGLGYGDNFVAVLISNCALEMDRFVNHAFPMERDTHVSAYLGDLLVTSYSQFSRNRTFGMMIGKGYGVKTAQIEMSMVAEGYYASECVHRANLQHQSPMPIAEAVHKVLYEGGNAKSVIRSLTSKLI